MQAFNFKKQLCAIALLLLGSVGASVQAATLSVNCGATTGLTSISAAIKVLKNREAEGPSTINVSGACHENVLIKDMDHLTISGTNGASITDAAGGTLDVVDVRNSTVTITGLTVDGLNGVNNDAIDCELGSHCSLIGNTIQGDSDAVGVYSLSTALIVGGVLRNTTSDGIRARGDVAVFGTQIQGNPEAVIVLKGGRMYATLADPASFPVHTVTATTMENNGAGVRVTEGAEFLCGGCIIENNAGDGIHADVSAAVTIQPGFPADGSTVPPAITGNTGVGVYVGDLSSVALHGQPIVSGNGQPDILCNSPTAVTRGAKTNIGGGTTNCAN